jgi:hypothetical protein
VIGAKRRVNKADVMPASKEAVGKIQDVAATAAQSSL